MLFGSLLGVLGGMTQGLRSSFLHHMLDMLLSIPSLLLAVVLVAVLGPGLDNAILAVTLTLLPQCIRAVYAAVNQELQKEYIIAVRLDGSTPLRILRLAILPNIVDTLVAQTTRCLATAILDISAICFLGIGAQSPAPGMGHHARRRHGSDLYRLLDSHAARIGNCFQCTGHPSRRKWATSGAATRN